MVAQNKHNAPESEIDHLRKEDLNMIISPLFDNLIKTAAGFKPEEFPEALFEQPPQVPFIMYEKTEHCQLLLAKIAGSFKRKESRQRSG
jgi:hypothetical protein